MDATLERNNDHDTQTMPCGAVLGVALGSALGVDVDAALGVAALLSRRWVLPVAVALAPGPLRRFQLAVRVAGISPKVLTETLRFLERSDVIERVLVRESDTTVGVAYALTPLGASLGEPVAALARWSTSCCADRVRVPRGTDRRST